jgi:hypothetical protein
MADLLIALENNSQPAISGRDNLKTMDLVEATYESADDHVALEIDQRKGPNSWRLPKQTVEAGYETGVSTFTPRAQQVLRLAREEARSFNHNFVGTEHLLLGLTALGQGVAVTVLAKLGLNLENAREAFEKQIGKGPEQKIIGNIPYTPRIKKVLALAARHAKNLDHTYVGTEHLLLGLLDEKDGGAARILKSFGVDMEKTREEILKELDPNRKQP